MGDLIAKLRGDLIVEEQCSESDMEDKLQELFEEGELDQSDLDDIEVQEVESRTVDHEITVKFKIY
jgi:hypothetical protein